MMPMSRGVCVAWALHFCAAGIVFLLGCLLTAGGTFVDRGVSALWNFGMGIGLAQLVCLLPASIILKTQYGEEAQRGVLMVGLVTLVLNIPLFLLAGLGGIGRVLVK